jgi:rRNA maturation endonuclease Nob1
MWRIEFRVSKQNKIDDYSIQSVQRQLKIKFIQFCFIAISFTLYCAKHYKRENEKLRDKL